MKKYINLNELHEQYYDAFQEVHQFMLNNSINYYAIEGTLLGAIRHNGFIPWDEDMDIGIPRQEYIRFLSLASNLNPSKFKIINYQCEGKVEHAITKIALLNVEKEGTRLINGFDNHFHIDVFPLDFVDGDFKKQKRVVKKSYIFKRFLYYKTRKINKKRPLRAIGLGVIKLALFPFTTSFLCKKIDKIVSQPNSSPTKDGKRLWISSGLYTFEKESHSIAIFGTPQEHIFGRCKIFIPEHPQDFLKNTYGEDYMIPVKRASELEYKIVLTCKESD